MAKLSAHGTELFRYEGSHYRLAYMSDGKILRDNGDGWKRYKKLNPGVDPEAHAEKARQFQINITPDRAMRAEFRRRMVEEFPCLETRAMVYLAIQLMPDDPDGVWSELDDRDEGCDIDTLVELCRLYKLACDEGREAREKRDPQPTQVGPALAA